MTQNFKQRFNIIKHRGTLTEVTTIWGDKVTKSDKLFVQNFPVGNGVYNGFIPCADYGNHFIYEVPDKIESRGYPSYMCTCGAIAVVVGSEGYNKDASPEGMMFVCMFRNGMFDNEKGEFLYYHADGSK